MQRRRSHCLLQQKMLISWCSMGCTSKPPLEMSTPVRIKEMIIALFSEGFPLICSVEK